MRHHGSIRPSRPHPSNCFDPGVRRLSQVYNCVASRVGNRIVISTKGVLRAGVVCLCAAGAVRADVFHLREGGKLDGAIVEDLGDALRIRTVNGVSDIEKERVARIEKGDPPWVRYEKKLKKCGETIKDQLALADWCRATGMKTEERRHLERVIALDAHHADARRRLGFVQEGGKWIKPKSTGAMSEAERTERRRAQADERRVQEKITEYTVKVKAVYRGRLSEKVGGEGSKAFADGRRQILEISDPLAIPGITSVLSSGHVAARRLMVEALAQFDVDEATMNLVAIALLDPSKEVRAMAARALKSRKDDRIVLELRSALRSEEEAILRNAATALGILKAKSAVRDLVPVLSTETVGLVRVSRWVSLDSLYGAYSDWQRYRVGGFPVLYKPSCIWAMGPGSIIGTVSGYEYQVISIHRTEVQEALIEISGQNLGFDAAAWLKWADDNGV